MALSAQDVAAAERARRRRSSTPSTTCRQRTRQPHDVIVDSRAWRGTPASASRSSASSIRDTGRVTEYRRCRVLKPEAPTGILGVRFDKDENPWLGMQFQGGIAKFDRKTETFQTWSLPPELNGPHVQINQVSPDRSHVDGKVWLQDAGTYTVLRLDLASGEVRGVRAVQDSAAERLRRDSRFEEQRLLPRARQRGRRPHRCQDRRDHDLQNADAALRPAPRHDGRAGPPVVRREQRRSHRHVRHADRALSGMAGADAGRLAVRRDGRQERRCLDAAASTTIAFCASIRRAASSSSTSCRARPTSGGSSSTTRTTPVTFWVGNNHGASIVKLEPLESPTPSDSRR